MQKYITQVKVEIVDLTDLERLITAVAAAASRVISDEKCMMMSDQKDN